MREDELLIERIISEINEELNSLLELKHEYRNFLQKYVHIDKYLLRVKASFLAEQVEKKK